jgi:putative membrane protein
VLLLSDSEDWVWILIIAITLVVVIPFFIWVAWGGMVRMMMPAWNIGWFIRLIYLILTVTAIIIAVFGVYYLVKRLSEKTSTKVQEIDKSLEILRERYARGEITREEYFRMKKDLEAESTEE